MSKANEKPSAISTPIAHVGINAVFLGPHMGGLETYARRLIPELAALRPEWRFSVFVNAAGKDLLAREAWPPQVELVTHPLLGRRYLRALSELTLLGRLAYSRGVDLLHSLAMMAPLRTRLPSVITIADVIWLHHLDSEERRTVRLWRTIVPLVARRADRIITLSDAARREIVAGLGVPASRIDIVPLGCSVDNSSPAISEVEIRSRWRLGDGPILVAVSATRAHKNLVRLIDAMSDVTAKLPTARLVIPGNPTAYQGELVDRARELGLADAIRFPGWISNRDLDGLYRCASCFVFPSLREGFGLPVVEAMARALPVACSNRSSLPEVAGDAARYFDPEAPADIARAVLEILLDPAVASALSSAGESRSKHFTWTATAEATIRSYERVAARA